MGQPTTNDTSVLLREPVGGALRRMTVPMCYGIIALISFHLVDTYFIALLGTRELAALAFTLPVAMLISALGIGLGIGTTAIVAHDIGAGNRATAARMVTHSMLLVIAVTAIVSTAGLLTIEPLFGAMGASPELLALIGQFMHAWYPGVVCLMVPMVGNAAIRATGDTQTPGRIMIGAAVLNAAFDPLLIFGLGPVPALGLAGSAVATVLAWSVAAFVCLYVLRFRYGLLEYRWEGLQALVSSWYQHARISVPAAMANMFTPLANGVLTAIVAAHGPAAVAAFGVGTRIEGLAILVVLALSMSLPPFISQNLGAQRMDRVAEALRVALRFVLLWELAVCFALFVFAGQIAGLFATDPEVTRIIKVFLYILPITYGCQGVIILTNSSFNALHEPKCAVVLSLIRFFVCYVPFAYVGSRIAGITGLYAGAALANVTVGALAFLWISRFLTRRLQPVFAAS